MLETIFFLILLALGMWLAWKIIKSVLKVIAFGIFVVLFLAVAGGFLFDRAADDFVAGFPGENRLLVLKDTDIVTSVYIENEDTIQVADDGNYSSNVTFTTAFFNEGLEKTFEIEEYVPGTFDREGMLELLTSDVEEEYRAYVFLSAVGHTLESNGKIFLYRQYKKGNIEIEPAPLGFVLSEKVPSMLVIPVLFFLSF